jgi:two-component system chemotaxis response regulator CheY
MRALVVDDELVIRKYLETVLSRFGTCDSAADGLEGVDLYLAAEKKGEPYDLLVMDIMMPKLDGLQALERIHEASASKQHRCRVIMLSCLADARQFQFACNDGMADIYLTKPIEVGGLLKALRDLGFLEEPEDIIP